MAQAASVDGHRSGLEALESEIERMKKALTRSRAVRSRLLRQWLAARRCCDDSWLTLDELRNTAVDRLALPPIPLAWADVQAPWARLVDVTDDAAHIVQAMVANWRSLPEARVVIDSVTRLENHLLWRYYQARKVELLADATTPFSMDIPGVLCLSLLTFRQPRCDEMNETRTRKIRTLSTLGSFRWFRWDLKFACAVKIRTCRFRDD